MAGAITYSCRKCGCEINVRGTGESHLRPIYCCGTKVAKILPSSMKTETKKKKRKKDTKAGAKTDSKAKGRVTKKTSVARKGQGG